MSLQVRDESGAETRAVDLDDAIFGAKVNVALMHQVVTSQLASGRAGTHKTKTRGEVRGGGRKPWRQKGTGKARHGSTREPQWVGGGTAFGPLPRDHSWSVNRKMRAIALRSALSDRAGENKIVVVEDPDFSEAPKTKRARQALDAWGVRGKALLVLKGDETNTAYAFRNLPDVHIVAEHQLNVYDVLNSGTVVFTASALERFQARAAQLPSRRRRAEAGAAAPALQVVPDAPEPPATEPEAPAEGGGEES